MYPGRAGFSLFSTTIESGGISTAFRVSKLIELWAKATKGTTKKARTINANILFIIFFLLLINMLAAPPGTLSTGSHTKCCRWSNRCASRETGSRVRIPEQFQNQTQSAQREGTRTECSNRYRGGVKKDTCGVEQTARLLLLEILQRAKVPVSLPAATQCL